MTTKYRLIHDEGYVERLSENNYIVIKVFSEGAGFHENGSAPKEIGQVKLQIVQYNDKNIEPEIKISLTGQVSYDNLVVEDK